jgi:hypothetical protein
MSLLKERIDADLKAALKASDRLRVSTLRLIKSAIKNREIDKGAPLTDEETIEVLSSLAKQRKEAIEEFNKASRTDLVHKEEEELSVIKAYLPEELSEDELEKIIQDTISEVGALSLKDMGKVMKTIMPKVKGRADGRVVNQKVRELLGG